MFIMSKEPYIYKNFSTEQLISTRASLFSMTAPSRDSGIYIKIFYNLAFYFTGIFIPPAIIFNILILCVMITSIKGIPETARLYYIVMSYGELGTVLFKDMLWLWLGVGWPSVLYFDILGQLNMHRASNHFIVCNLVIFIWYTHELIANHTMILFAIERVVALYAPLHVHAIFTFKRSLKILFVIIICAILVSLITFKFIDRISYEGLPIGTICIFSGEIPVWSQIGITVFVCDLIVPAILSIICSILIALKLVRRRLDIRVSRRRARKQKERDEQHSIISTISNSVPLHTLSISSTSRILPINSSTETLFTHSTYSAKELSACVTILFISCLHLIFYLPVSAFRVTYLLMPAITILQKDVQDKLEV